MKGIFLEIFAWEGMTFAGYPTRVGGNAQPGRRTEPHVATPWRANALWGLEA